MEAGAFIGVSWEGFSHCKREVLASLSSQTFLQKASSLVSSLVWSFQGSPAPHALLFLTSPAWLSSTAQHEAVTVKEPCTFLKLRLQASPVWPLNCIPMLLGIVCSGLPARALLQRRGAPIEIHSSR